MARSWVLLTLAATLSLGSPASDATAQGRPALEFRPRDRVVLLGNTLAERMQLFNHFETLLAARFPELSLSVRNLGWSGDTVALQPRPLNFGTTPTHLYRQKADVVIAFFGLNESFDGEMGLPQFEHDLVAWLRANLAAQYNGTSAPRLVVVSPIAHERLARLPGVDVDVRNRELARYTAAMARVCAEQQVAFVDLFTPTLALMAIDSPASPKQGEGGPNRGGGGLTINGIHLNESGDRIVAGLLMTALGFDKGQRLASAAQVRQLEQLRELIGEKNQQFFYRWRPVNAEYVVGRRVEPFGSVNFPVEMQQLDALVAARDRQIRQRSQAVKGLGYPAQLPAATPGAAQ